MHILENDHLTISASTLGSELRSIKSKSSDIEYLWQGNPKIWGGQAPNLFPIVGTLKEDAYYHKGKQYQLPRHGFLRKSDSTVHEKTKDAITFVKKYDNDTLKVYPFKFELFTTFKLNDTSIVVLHKVVNIGDNEMLFSIGAHPGFNCPLHKGEAYNEYYLEFDQDESSESYLLDDQGLISNKTFSIIDKNKIRLTNSLFNQDALIFKDLKSKSVSLKHDKHGEVLSINFEGYPFMGIWAKPEAPFICIEPWLGYSDISDTNQILANKEGIIRLPKEETFNCAYTISINT